jgi:ketosteroid isomerase-like protein
MCYYTCLLLALCISAATARAANAQQLSPVEQEVVNARKTRVDAGQKRDAASWSAFVADDYIFIHDVGVLHTKADTVTGWSKEDKSQIPVTTGSPEEMQIRLHGDTAVITCKVKWDDDIGAQHHAAYSRITELYQRQKGKWLIISKQETVIACSATPVAPAHPELYAEYAGEYQVGPNFLIHVTHVGDKLFESWPGDDQPEELLPLTESSFFARSGGLYEFVRDSSGKVITYRYRDPAGDVVAKKIH